jgi:hypothetical protein
LIRLLVRESHAGFRSEVAMNRAGQGSASIGAVLRAHGALAGTAVAAALPLMLVSHLVPPEVVLPALSILFLSAGSALALLAWCIRSDRNANQVTLWDLAGACTFVGFAAGILSTPESVLAAFGVSAGG